MRDQYRGSVCVMDAHGYVRAYTHVYGSKRRMWGACLIPLKQGLLLNLGLV